MLSWLQWALHSEGQSCGCERCQVAGLGWREDGFCCSSCGRELCDVCPSFILGRARISWDSCFSDPREGEGRAPCWSLPRAGPQCEFPTLMTFIQAARWMDTSDQRKPLVKGTEYPAGMGGGTVDPTESALPGELSGSEATPFSTLAYAVGLARRGLCLFWALL